MSLILVVDDMTIVREPIAAALARAGHRTACAGDGRAALALMAAEVPDLVLLDVSMPDMDGLAVLHRMRGDSRTAQVPVILLTAAADRDTVLHAARYGVQDYVLKSRFSLADLLARVNRRLSIAVAPGEGPAAAARPAPVGAGRPPGEAAEDVPVLLTREQSIERAETALQARTLSGVVMQVAGVAGSVRADASTLSGMISRDALLSSRVLQAANSAAYLSSAGPVTSVAHAVRQIGFSAVRSVAAAIGVFDAMPASDPNGYNPIRCWQHSFAVAMLCERLAARTDVNPGVAYLVGLCHDLGEILFHTRFGKEYAATLAQEARTGRPRAEVERAMLGITQSELLTIILKRIALPDAIRGPIEAFHAAGRALQVPVDPTARILRIAEAYANGLQLASAGNAAVTTLTRAECRAACGEDHPPAPDADAMRGEIRSLTVTLARASSAEERAMLAPLHPRGRARLWLVRGPAFSKFDPVAVALESMASVTVHDRPPETADAAQADGVVLLRAGGAAAGVGAGGDGSSVRLPTLYVTGTAVSATPPVPTAKGNGSRGLLATLDQLATFVAGLAVEGRAAA